MGSRAGETEEPTGLVALTVEYFGPNGEPIPDGKLCPGTDQTGEKDGYGMAIATAFKTPASANVIPATDLLSGAEKLYQQLVALKRQRLTQIKQPESLENINITSDRINRINRRVSQLDRFPTGIDRTMVRNTFKKLNTWKEMKQVQKLLRDYTDGDKAKLDDVDFVIQPVQDTDKLNLISNEGIKLTSLQVYLTAFLLRV